VASAFKKIRGVPVDENELEHLLTWSDLRVPQNRSSIISIAALDFIRDSPNISITKKYSLPGYSCVQEVDIVHSQKKGI